MYRHTGYALGQNIGAVAGFSTNIPCDFGRQEEAPFWIINGTVYELFSIPRNFPFIPVVDSFSTLHIPFVYLALNGITFQCITFDERGADVGELARLTVEDPSMNFNIAKPHIIYVLQ